MSGEISRNLKFSAPSCAVRAGAKWGAGGEAVEVCAAGLPGAEEGFFSGAGLQAEVKIPGRVVRSSGDDCCAGRGL